MGVAVKYHLRVGHRILVVLKDNERWWGIKNCGGGDFPGFSSFFAHLARICHFDRILLLQTLLAPSQLLMCFCLSFGIHPHAHHLLMLLNGIFGGLHLEFWGFLREK